MIIPDSRTYCEQQLPYLLPVHMVPLSPPHLPSLLTISTGDGVWLPAQEPKAVWHPEIMSIETEHPLCKWPLTIAAVVVRAATLLSSVMVSSDLENHLTYPYCEQHDPYFEPRHVTPVPHFPLVETGSGFDGSVVGFGNRVLVWRAEVWI